MFPQLYIAVRTGSIRKAPNTLWGNPAQGRTELGRTFSVVEIITTTKGWVWGKILDTTSGRGLWVVISTLTHTYMEPTSTPASDSVLEPAQGKTASHILVFNTDGSRTKFTPSG